MVIYHCRRNFVVYSTCTRLRPRQASAPNSPTEHRASASSPLTALESDDSISGYGHDEYDSSQDGDTTGTDAHRNDAADTTMDPPHEPLAAADILAALPEYLFDLEDEEEDFEMYM